MKDFIKKPHIL